MHPTLRLVESNSQIKICAVQFKQFVTHCRKKNFSFIIKRNQHFLADHVQIIVVFNPREPFLILFWPFVAHSYTVTQLHFYFNYYSFRFYLNLKVTQRFWFLFNKIFSKIRPQIRYYLKSYFGLDCVFLRETEFENILLF